MNIILIFSFSSSTGISNNLKPPNARSSTQTSNGRTVPEPKYNSDAKSRVGDRKVVSEEKRSTASNATTSQAQVVKPNNSQQHDASLAPSNSVVGVYSSSTDPVHVPSPDSRSSGAAGAIKREVGVVGGRRQSENAVKDLSSSNSFSESFHPLTAISNTDQVSHTAAIEHMPDIPVNRSFLHNHYNSRPHQQTVGHPKGFASSISSFLR